MIFFVGVLYDAGQKPFWKDETHGIEQSSRRMSYSQLLTQGAPAQGSPSPLDYIIIKFVDQFKSKGSYPDEVYYRIFPAFITVFCLFMAMMQLKKKIFDGQNSTAVKLVQTYLVILIPFAYLFTTMVFYYAKETRPYTLWNSLYFLSLVLFLFYPSKKIGLIVTLSLLGFTATASVFQMAALVMAFMIVCLIQKTSLKKIFYDSAAIFFIPFVVALYYCFKTGKWNMIDAGGDWGDFLKFWQHHMTIVPLMLCGLALALLHPDNRGFAVVPLAYLILYLLGPVIFWATQWKGFFFIDRQFIYYEMKYALLLISALLCIPAYLKNLKSSVAIVCILIMISGIASAVGLKDKYLKRFVQIQKNAFTVLSGL